MLGDFTLLCTNKAKSIRITSKNNLVFDGYNWCEAHYLNPLAQNVFRQTASGDKTDLNTSNIYQNPGWPMIDGQGPTGY